LLSANEDEQLGGSLNAGFLTPKDTYRLAPFQIGPFLWFARRTMPNMQNRVAQRVGPHSKAFSVHLSFFCRVSLARI
jgi:hypothetical protein